MSSITGASFTSGAAGAGLNEAVIKEIDKIAKHDPGAAQIVSAIVGAAAARAAGGTAGAGAAAAASGTRNIPMMEMQQCRFKRMKQTTRIYWEKIKETARPKGRTHLQKIHLPPHGKKTKKIIRMKIMVKETK